MKTVNKSQVSVVSATMSDLVDSSGVVGQIRFDPNSGNIYVLGRALASTAYGIACQWIYSGGRAVSPAAIIGSKPACVNDTGVSVTANYYYWGLVYGEGHVLSAGAFSLGDVLQILTTAGKFDTATTGVPCAMAEAAATGADQVIAALVNCLGGMGAVAGA